MTYAVQKSKIRSFETASAEEGWRQGRRGGAEQGGVLPSGWLDLAINVLAYDSGYEPG